jgi:hypothetical protein
MSLLLLTAPNAYTQEVKTVYLSDTQVVQIPVSNRGTVLSFPAKPNKVILGNTGTFGVEYVEADLAISPLRPGARSNLFVYLMGRRFTFDLRTSMDGGYSIVVVHDAIEAPSKGAKRNAKQ